MSDDFNDLFENDSISRGEAQRLVAEEVQKTLREISTFGYQAQAGVTAAVQELQARHPDFEQQRPKMLAVLDEIELLRDAVRSAESNPQLSPALPQMYEVVYRASKAPTDNTGTATAAAEPSKPTDLSDEGTQYQAALASQRVDLSPENRKSLIASLESKGVLDVEF